MLISEKEGTLKSIMITCLSLSVDAYYAGGGLVGRCHEYCVAADAVHVDTGARLQVVQVHVAVFGYHVNDVVFVANLHSHREVVLGLGGEEDVHILLSEWLVTSGRRSNFDNMQLETQKYINIHSLITPSRETSCEITSIHLLTILEWDVHVIRSI